MPKHKSLMPEKRDDTSEKKTETGWGNMKGNSVTETTKDMLVQKENSSLGASLFSKIKFNNTDPEWKIITIENSVENHRNIYRVSLGLISEYDLNMNWKEVADIIKQKNNLDNEYSVNDKEEIQVPTLLYFRNHYADKVNEKKLDDIDKYEEIKQKYFEIVDKGESHYMEAIQYIADTFNLDTSHAEMSYDASITGAFAITGGNIGDEKVPVRFATVAFNKNLDFGVICRGVAHELIHTVQKSVDQMYSHDEREFLAYYDTITRTDMPEIKDVPTLELYFTKIIKYYNALPDDKKTLYKEKMDEILVIKNNKGL